MEEFFNVNGQIIEAERVDVFNNRAFKYGDGLFESIRIVNGNALFLEQHFQRLSNGLGLLKIQNPFTFISFASEINKCIDANKIKKGGRVRFTAYRDSTGYYTPDGNKLAYLIEISELPDNLYNINPQGMKIDICDSIKIDMDEFSNLKTLNALPYVMAGIYKKEKQLDEVLLLNSKGDICEGSSSNLFLFAKNTLLTPPLSHGCVNGIMRNEILKIAGKLQLRVVENSVSIQEMEIAEEIFFTNAIQGINWVSAFHKKRYFNIKAKVFLKELNRMHSL